ncbi:MAG: Ig-like domain-containing protein [Edaphocola sp.]
MNNQHSFLRLIALLAIFGCAVALAPGCANIVPPAGGAKDTIPPVLLSMYPADSGLNISPKKIVLRFDKFMEVKDLEKNMAMSPLLNINPTVISYGKRIEITIADSQLAANTTYNFSLGNSLVDNRENTPYKGFTYLFSTGSYFDSLQLAGSIVNAATGHTDSGMLVALYNANESDTAVMRKKPLYIARADPSGKFKFEALPHKAFRIYAIKDANNNYIYDLGQDAIGFLDSTVKPAFETSPSITLYTFGETIDTGRAAPPDSLKQKPATAPPAPPGHLPKYAAGPNAGKGGKDDFGYRVQVDTNNLAKRSFDINKPLVVTLFSDLAALDNGRVYLSYDNNGIEVEAVSHIKADSGTLKITTQWQEDKVYTLRLVKGWATDTAGKDVMPGKYRFRTMGSDDYANLIIHLAKDFYDDSMVLFVYRTGTGKDADSVYQKPVTDSIVTLKRLVPGEYGMRIIVDKNRNGVWDGGNLLERKQPEKVLPYCDKLILKTGWDTEQDFGPANTDCKDRKSIMGNDPGNKPKPKGPPTMGKPGMGKE